MIPRIFKINQASPISGALELATEGHDQCFTGRNPSVILSGDILEIRTNPRIRTPGFEGIYEFKRE